MSLAKRQLGALGRTGGRQSVQRAMKRSLNTQADELNKFLEQLPGVLQSKAFEKGLRPAAKVMRQRVKELTPRSSNTGTTKKWSQSTKQKRMGNKPLWKTASFRIWKSPNGTPYAFVGYKWPDGNKGHFVIEGKNNTRKVFYWGKDAGKVVQRMDVLKRAFDETINSAASSFTAGVKAAVEKEVERLAVTRRLDGG